MIDHKWVSRSTWPDPHMTLFLDRLRARGEEWHIDER
jgi:hypothetical protein